MPLAKIPAPISVSQTCRNPLQNLSARQTIVALGRFAREAKLAAICAQAADHRFGRGAQYWLKNGVILIGSYHHSRHNQNIGRISHKMLKSVFEMAMQYPPATLPQHPQK